MNCRTLQSQLSAFLDGELSGRDMIRFREHLSQCTSCRQEEADLRALKDLLCSGPAVEPAADFEERLFANVMREADRTRRLTPSFPVLSGFAIAAMALTFAVVNSLGRPDATPRSQPKADSIAFEVRRDQATTAGIDPLGGSVVVPTNFNKH